MTRALLLPPKSKLTEAKRYEFFALDDPPIVAVPIKTHGFIIYGHDVSVRGKRVDHIRIAVDRDVISSAVPRYIFNRLDLPRRGLRREIVGVRGG